MALVVFDEQEGPHRLTRKTWHDAVRATFGTRAPKYDEGKIGEDHIRWVETLVELYPPKFPALDVACGTGYLAKYASPQGHGFTNLDITPEMMEFAKKRCPLATHVIAEAEKLPFDSISFSSIYCCSAMMYFTDVLGFLRDTVRVLAPGGFLAAQVFSGDSHIVCLCLERACAMALGKERGRGVFCSPNKFFGNPDQLKETLSDAGFVDMEVELRQEMELLDINALQAKFTALMSNPFMLKYQYLDENEKNNVSEAFVNELEKIRMPGGMVQDRCTHMFVRAYVRKTG